MEKQIEEMVEIIELAREKCRAIQCINCETYNNGAKCIHKLYAKYLTEQGYRKQVQGEWIKILDCAYYIEDTETGETKFYNQYVCSNCGKVMEETSVENCENYCSNCGAKMKGN